MRVVVRQGFYCIAENSSYSERGDTKDTNSSKKKGKGMFLYSAVSSPLHRSKRFTLFAFPDRPVHSDTN